MQDSVTCCLMKIYIHIIYIYIYINYVDIMYNIYIMFFFIHMKLEYKFHGRFSLALHCAFLLFFTINREKPWHTGVPAVILRLGAGEELHIDSF